MPFQGGFGKFFATIDFCWRELRLVLDLTTRIPFITGTFLAMLRSTRALAVLSAIFHGVGVACNDDADADNRVEGAVLGERGGGKWQFSCTWDAPTGGVAHQTSTV